MLLQSYASEPRVEYSILISVECMIILNQSTHITYRGLRVETGYVHFSSKMG